MRAITRTAAPILVAAILIFALALTVSAQTRDVVNTLIARVLRVQNSAQFDGPATFNAALVATDTVAVTGNASIGGNLAVTGDTALAADLNLAPQTAISVTNGGIITPTGALQRLTSAGNVTATLAAPAAGQVIVLFNSSSTTITIEDTTGQALSANAALGQWDTLTIVGYGNSFYEVARSNN